MVIFSLIVSPLINFLAISEIGWEQEITYFPAFIFLESPFKNTYKKKKFLFLISSWFSKLVTISFMLSPFSIKKICSAPELSLHK